MVILFDRDNIGIINLFTLYTSYTILKSSSLAILYNCTVHCAGLL